MVIGIFTTSGIVCTLSVWNVSRLLRKQIELAHETQTYVKAKYQVRKWHPISAAIRVSDCRVYERQAKCSPRFYFFAKTAERHNRRSVFGGYAGNLRHVSNVLEESRENIPYISLYASKLCAPNETSKIFSEEIRFVWFPVSFCTGFEQKEIIKIIFNAQTTDYTNTICTWMYWIPPRFAFRIRKLKPPVPKWEKNSHNGSLPYKCPCCVHSKN